MSLVMVYVEIYARANVLIYYKATGINMLNPADAGVIVIVVHTVTVIEKVEMMFSEHLFL